MWSNLLPSAQRHHNLLIITQCSVLPDNLVRCVTGQLEVPPLSLLQSTWMFARLTRRLCSHASQPSSWIALCKDVHQLCKDCENVSRPGNMRAPCGMVRLENDCQRRPVLEAMHGICCAEMYQLAQLTQEMHGLPIIISLQSKAFSCSSLDEQTLQLTDGARSSSAEHPMSNQVHTSADIDDITRSVCAAWLKHYSRLSLPARQLLNTIVFLHPDKIHAHLLLSTDPHWMPAELYAYVHCRASEDRQSCLQAAFHSVLILLSELQQHSMISYSAHGTGTGRYQSDLSSAFCLHRRIQFCTLRHLQQDGSFTRCLDTTVCMLMHNLGHSPSYSYTESCILPHIVALSVTNLLNVCLPCRPPVPFSDPTELSSLLGDLSSSENAIALHNWTRMLTSVCNVLLTFPRMDCNLLSDLLTLPVDSIDDSDGIILRLKSSAEQESRVQLAADFVSSCLITLPSVSVNCFMSALLPYIRPLLTKWDTAIFVGGFRQIPVFNVHPGELVPEHLSGPEIRCRKRNLGIGKRCTFLLLDHLVNHRHSPSNAHVSYMCSCVNLEKPLKLSMILLLLSSEAALYMGHKTWRQMWGDNGNPPDSRATLLTFFNEHCPEYRQDITASVQLFMECDSYQSHQGRAIWHSDFLHGLIPNGAPLLRQKRTFPEIIILAMLYISDKNNDLFTLNVLWLVLFVLMLHDACCEDNITAQVTWQRAVCFKTEPYSHWFHLAQNSLFYFLGESPALYLLEEALC